MNSRLLFLTQQTMEKMAEILAKRQAPQNNDGSAQNDTQTWKCKICHDSWFTGREVHFWIYWTGKEFCDCELGKSTKEKWKQEPAQIESFRKYKMEKVERLLAKSQVWPRFRSKRFSDLKDSPKLLELCQKYVDNFKEYKEHGWWLYFWGNIWSWKTHAATAVCNELIEKHLTEILFVNMSDAANRVKDSFSDNRSNDSDLFEDMKKAELLVIDDIGVEKVTEWLTEQLFLVINHRYENNLPIVVTSNQSLQDLGTLHKPQIASRLDEMCKSVKFTWKDRREDKRPTF